MPKLDDFCAQARFRGVNALVISTKCSLVKYEQMFYHCKHSNLRRVFKAGSATIIRDIGTTQGAHMYTRNVRYIKRYVRVVAEMGPDGHITPLCVLWPDGRRFDVDDVIETGYSSSAKTGSSGVRYVVEIAGQRKILWRDGRGFFVESPQARPIG